MPDNSNPTVAQETQPDPTVNSFNQIAQTTGGDSSLTLMLAMLAVVGGGAVLLEKFNSRTWVKEKPVNFDLLEFYTEYNVLINYLRYTVKIKTKTKRNRQNIVIARGKLRAKYFELSLETEEKLRDFDARVISRKRCN